MDLSYHHANPHGGNESFLLRFQFANADSPTTILVDAGAELELDRILNRNEMIDAVCLTHAHSDHYQSLDQCIDADTSVYTSPATAQIIGDVLDIAAQQPGVKADDSLASAIEPVDGWTSVGSEVAFHPVPAGHVPGAVGYLFRFEKDQGVDTGYILATGDFTLTRAGGYPEFPLDSIQDVDVLFLTVATSSNFSSELSEALGIALQQAHSGMQTLVTTSGIVGVHVAYLLGALIERFELGVRVRVVGQAAKLYERLEYEADAVRPVPEFSHTDEALGRGIITIAGPDVPSERSSGRLYGVLRDQPDACVVQLIGSGQSPIRSGQCTVHDFRIVNHPEYDALESVHESANPQHTVITHTHRGAGNQFNHLNSNVWSPSDSGEYTLYANGQWRAPPWAPNGGRTPTQATTQSVGALTETDLFSDVDLPSLSRSPTVDLPAEGIDIEHVKQVLAQETAYTGPTTTEAADSDTGSSTATARKPNSPSMTTSDDDQDDTKSDSQGSPAESVGLVRTTGASFNQLDDWVVSAIKSGELSKADLKEIARRSQQSATSADETESPDDENTDGAGDADHNTSQSDSVRSTAESDDSDATTPTDSDKNVDSPDAPSVSPDSKPETETTETQSTSENPETETTETYPAPESPTTSTEQEDNQGFFVVLDPLTTSLATHLIAETDEGPMTIADVATDATTAYLGDRLRGIETEPETSVSSHSSIVDQALAGVVTDSDEFTDLDSFKTTAYGELLGDLVGLDKDDQTLSVTIGVDPALVDAVTEHPASPTQSRDDVVATAVLCYAGADT
ncbi:MBL fold metallo-hydrolase [Halorubrum sp. SD690R]|uniref:MBL fold metallo-hydrolase n=1 Tax=Halorubrum sp. SD690R TaxID=2518117 RepID=UPI00130531D6|nr:MBL fold metallo-hydrolase [Halorubrum sp. SD690R]